MTKSKIRMFDIRTCQGLNERQYIFPAREKYIAESYFPGIIKSIKFIGFADVYLEMTSGGIVFKVNFLNSAYEITDETSPEYQELHSYFGNEIQKFEKSCY